MINKEQLLSKIVGMFRSYAGDSFLNYNSSDVICGPNDRALYGFDTIFPIEWLVEDFGFTKEEARTFIDMVHLKDKEQIKLVNEKERIKHETN